MTIKSDANHIFLNPVQLIFIQVESTKVTFCLKQLTIAEFNEFFSKEAVRITDNAKLKCSFPRIHWHRSETSKVTNIVKTCSTSWWINVMSYVSNSLAGLVTYPRHNRFTVLFSSTGRFFKDNYYNTINPECL